MQARIETVRRQLSDVEQGPRVFFELDPLLYTVGPDSFIGSLLTTLKAQNIAEDAGGPFPQISVETVVERDPQVILFTDSATESPETIAGRAGWDTITAVQEGRVFPVQSDLVSRPGPRIVEGLESLAMLLYPDLLARSGASPQPTPTAGPPGGRLMEPVLLSWSGGKDSSLALHRVQQQGKYEVVAPADRPQPRL